MALLRREHHFNCTIQELKQAVSGQAIQVQQNFNCTIQELKPQVAVANQERQKVFQLHHTGIKTI